MMNAPRNIGDVGADYDAHRGYSADHGSTHPVDHPAPTDGDEERQQVV